MTNGPTAAQEGGSESLEWDQKAFETDLSLANTPTQVALLCKRCLVQGQERGADEAIKKLLVLLPEKADFAAFLKIFGNERVLFRLFWAMIDDSQRCSLARMVNRRLISLEISGSEMDKIQAKLDAISGERRGAVRAAVAGVAPAERAKVPPLAKEQKKPQQPMLKRKPAPAKPMAAKPAEVEDEPEQEPEPLRSQQIRVPSITPVSRGQVAMGVALLPYGGYLLVRWLIERHERKRAALDKRRFEWIEYRARGSVGEDPRNKPLFDPPAPPPVKKKPPADVPPKRASAIQPPAGGRNGAPAKPKPAAPRSKPPTPPGLMGSTIAVPEFGLDEGDGEDPDLAQAQAEIEAARKKVKRAPAPRMKDVNPFGGNR